MARRMSDVEWIARKMLAGDDPRLTWEGVHWMDKQDYRSRAKQAIRLVTAAKKRKGV